MTIPLIILAVLAAFLGFAGSPWLVRDIHTLLAPAATRAAGLDISLLLASNILALAGIILGVGLYGRDRAPADPLRRLLGPVYTALEKKLWVDELYMLLIRGLFFSASRLVAWFDRHVVDGAVNLFGAASKAGRAVVRRTVTGKVQGYVLTILGGAALVLVYLLIRGGAR